MPPSVLDSRGSPKTNSQQPGQVEARLPQTPRRWARWRARSAPTAVFFLGRRRSEHQLLGFELRAHLGQRCLALELGLELAVPRRARTSAAGLAGSPAALPRAPALGQAQLFDSRVEFADLPLLELAHPRRAGRPSRVRGPREPPSTAAPLVTTAVAARVRRRSRRSCPHSSRSSRIASAGARAVHVRPRRSTRSRGRSRRGCRSRGGAAAESAGAPVRRAICSSPISPRTLRPSARVS